MNQRKGQPNKIRISLSDCRDAAMPQPKGYCALKAVMSRPIVVGLARCRRSARRAAPL